MCWLSNIPKCKEYHIQKWKGFISKKCRVQTHGRVLKPSNEPNIIFNKIKCRSSVNSWASSVRSGTERYYSGATLTEGRVNYSATATPTSVSGNSGVGQITSETIALYVSEMYNQNQRGSTQFFNPIQDFEKVWNHHFIYLS